MGAAENRLSLARDGTRATTVRTVDAIEGRIEGADAGMLVEGWSPWTKTRQGLERRRPCDALDCVRGTCHLSVWDG
jgi:hypothetical protein